MGSDVKTHSKSQFARFQSTLPHGERLSQLPNSTPRKGFNPRSHMGSDSFSRAVRVSIRLFQSTLPHGERHQLRLQPRMHASFNWSQSKPLPNNRRLQPRMHASFNPRSHMGSDPDDVLQPDEEEKVSIHAPTWGATSVSL